MLLSPVTLAIDVKKKIAGKKTVTNRLSYPVGGQNSVLIPAQQSANSHHDLMVFFNAMDEVFFSVDMVNEKVILISAGCERLYGYKPGDFLNNHMIWFDLIHPDDRHIVNGEDILLNRGEQVNNQYRIIRKDKTVRWVENKIIPALDSNGNLIRV